MGWSVRVGHAPSAALLEAATPSISPEELALGSRLFEEREGRNSMYRVATFLLKEWWGQYGHMTDALTVLLLTWNGAFYRYGMFDQDTLEACLKAHWPTIDGFRPRSIASMSAADEAPLRVLFLALREALRIAHGKHAGAHSSVAVAKTLHLLAPHFLPIWDQRIAHAYDCRYARDPAAAYQRFCWIIRDIAATLAPIAPDSDKTLLKRIDEFNYAKYSKGWIA